MNLELKDRFVNETLGFSLTYIEYKGEPVFLPKEVGIILEYKDVSGIIRDMISSGELEDGKDTILFTGEELASLKSFLESVNKDDVGENHLKYSPESNVVGYDVALISSNIPAYRLLKEPGLNMLIFRSGADCAIDVRKWIAREVLPAIRKTGGYKNKDINLGYLSSEYEAALKIASLFGLTGNQAKLSAANAVRKRYDENLIEDFKIELKSEVQDILMTPTEIGEKFGLSARAINKILEAFGYQTKGDQKSSRRWHMTSKAKDANLGEYLDTTKRHTSGTPIQQLKWYSRIIDIIKANLE